MYKIDGLFSYNPLVFSLTVDSCTSICRHYTILNQLTQYDFNGPEGLCAGFYPNILWLVLSFKKRFMARPKQYYNL